MAGAKAIARYEWKLYFEDLEPSDATIKDFVLTFRYRWRGDHLRRYEVLVAWVHEFIHLEQQAAPEADTRAGAVDKARRAAELRLREREIRRFVVLDLRPCRRE